MGETNVLFSIGPLEVTGAVVTMWVIVAVLALVSWLATRKLRDVPGPLQNAPRWPWKSYRVFTAASWARPTPVATSR